MKRTSRRILLVLAAWAAIPFALPSPSAEATSFKRASTKELVGKAQRIVCVECVRQEAKRDPLTGFVFTHVEFRVLEEWMGDEGVGTLRLRLAGGQVGDLKTVVHGMPTFRRGGECVLILGRKNKLGYRSLVQLRRGVLPLRVVRQQERSVRRVATVVTGFEELRATAGIDLDRLRGVVTREVHRVIAARKKEQERKAREARDGAQGTDR